eukprot:11245320-Karenia_brevis.AAC.1
MAPSFKECTGLHIVAGMSHMTAAIYIRHSAERYGRPPTPRDKPPPPYPCLLLLVRFLALVLKCL